MIHGYMAGGAFFYKMLSHLRSSFNVVMIDTLGQGSSGRPEIAPSAFQDYSSTVSFFVTALNRYTQRPESALYGDGSFYLLAHSMGSIYASHYALVYPKRVKALILLSPVGIDQIPPGDNSAIQSGPIRFLEAVGRHEWSTMTLTPQDMYRMMGYSLSHYQIRTSLKTSRQNYQRMTRDEISTFVRYNV